MGRVTPMDWDLTKDLNVSQTPCDLYLSKEQVEKVPVHPESRYVSEGGPVLGTLGVGM